MKTMSHKKLFKIFATINILLSPLAVAQVGDKGGNGGGDDIELAGYVAKYMTYHYRASSWLEKFYSDGTLSQKLSLDKLNAITRNETPVTADLVMEQFNNGSAPNVKVEFLPRNHKVNEKIVGIPDDRICGNSPTQKLIICSIDEWDKAEQGKGSNDYSFGGAIFGALDIHERLGVAGFLEQNDGPVSQYPISGQILQYRHALPTVDYDYTDTRVINTTWANEKCEIILNSYSPRGYDFSYLLLTKSGQHLDTAPKRFSRSKDQLQAILMFGSQERDNCEMLFNYYSEKYSSTLAKLVLHSGSESREIKDTRDICELHIQQWDIAHHGLALTRANFDSHYDTYVYDSDGSYTVKILGLTSTVCEQQTKEILGKFNAKIKRLEVQYNLENPQVLTDKYSRTKIASVLNQGSLFGFLKTYYKIKDRLDPKYHDSFW